MAGRSTRRTGVVTAIPKESDAQAQFFDWLALIPTVTGRKLIDFSFAVPNGAMLAGTSEQRARYMSFLKRRGLKAGVSDTVIAFPIGKYHGAFIELKRDKSSKTAPEQIAWINLMRSVGYFAEIGAGFDGAKQHVLNYLASAKS